MAEGFDLTLDDFKMRLNDLKQRISFLRKKGANLSIADMKIAAIPSKMKYAEVTRDFKDTQKISKMLEDAKKESDDAEEELINSMIENIPLNAMLYLMDKIEDALRLRKNDDAKNLYTKCQALYQKLNNEQKKEVFKRLNDVRSKL